MENCSSCYLPRSPSIVVVGGRLVEAGRYKQESIGGVSPRHHSHK